MFAVLLVNIQILQVSFFAQRKGVRPVDTDSSCRLCRIEKNYMGGACSAYGGEERRIQDFGGET